LVVYQIELVVSSISNYMLLPKHYFNFARKNGLIKTGWELAEKNNELRKLEKYHSLGFTSLKIKELNAWYWTKGECALEKVTLV
jgi:hypothetical protein